MSADILPRPVTAVTREQAWKTTRPWRYRPSTQPRVLPLNEPTLDAPRSGFQTQSARAATSDGSKIQEKTSFFDDRSVSRDGSTGRDIEKSAPCRAAPAGWPVQPAPVDGSRKLTRTELRVQRVVFIAFVLAVNLGLAAVTVFGKVGLATLVIILFFKTQDCLCVLVSAVCLAWTTVAGLFRKPEPLSRRWILSLLPAYNESEEQILRSIQGLRKNVQEPHRQVVAIVLDGQPKEIKHEFSHIVADFERPYHSLKHKVGTLKVTAGFFDDLPVIMIEKAQNSGKKDSLVLTHDLFNHPRKNMPAYSRFLREELWTNVLPLLTAGTDFGAFDMVFCTDADSVIHDGCIMKLTDRLARDGKAIAACGLVLVEFEPGHEWSFWNFFQLLQYAYGQFVRRWAEGFVGKVTCLPGCVTMIAVREEMAGAIAKFARPVKEDWVLHHQVQNLGTDRRLTYCMLSQGKKLRTLFVPDALSETVAPQSFKHYLHQRRRWGSNAYFNNFFYFAGVKMILFTRFIAFLHILRQTCVYYRVLNTILFIRCLVLHFNIMDILPLLVVGQLPGLWFCICLLIQRSLRVRIHKIIVGWLLNKIVSPIMSSIVFAAVVTNLGNAVWGMSGITASSTSTISPRPQTQSTMTSKPSSSAGSKPPSSAGSKPPSSAGNKPPTLPG
ncbi:hypothetical protein CDD83_10809 [Cordyceps sp. RAO-2017]|nr:hypothetical protein CDD83_10809 [Cordyceps sp. RAO-2017]